MKRTFVVTGILLVLALAAASQRRGSNDSPAGNTEPEKRIIATLDDIVKDHHTYLSVPPQDGKALRMFAEAIGARNAVEIGTSTGYSGLWLCLALRRTGGHLTTFEIDRERAAMAREHFREAGVENMVTIVQGNAHEQVAKVEGPVDLAFIDADKDGYVDYLNKLLPLVRPGGLILAHNIEMAPAYVKLVTTNPGLETIFYREGAGLGVTLKER